MRAGLFRRIPRSFRGKAGLGQGIVATCVIVAIVVSAVAMRALAQQDQQTFYLVNVDNEWISRIPNNRNVYRYDGAGVAYCAQAGPPGPAKNGTTYKWGWDYAQGCLAYVAYHGYPHTTVIGGRQWDEKQAEYITQIAVWMVTGGIDENFVWQIYNGDIVPGTPHWTCQHTWTEEMRQATRDLAAQARAYETAGGGGVEAHFAHLYSAGSTGMQPMLLIPRLGTASLQKSSAEPAVSSGNGCYALAGARYVVTRSNGDDWEAQETGAQFVTDESGYSVMLDPDGNVHPGLDAGIYYVREVEAPKGYSSDDSFHELHIDAGSTAQANVLHVDDQPLSDSIDFSLQKVDADGNDVELPSGDSTLEGAQFTVRFYEGEYDGVEALPAAPNRTWVIRTREYRGVQRAYLSDDYKVSGDDWYAVKDGWAAMPLGTFTVQETKAPQGYGLTDGSVHLGRVVADPSRNTGTRIDKIGAWSQKFTKDDYAGLSVEDRALAGGVRVQKVDAETGRADPQGDASLAQAEFSITNRSANAVTVDGKPRKPSEVVRVIRTGGDGVAQTGDHDLPYGTYEVRETGAPEGYQGNAGWARTFQVREDGRVVDLAAAKVGEPVQHGGIAVAKVDRETKAQAPLADATLADAAIEVRNKSANDVVVLGRAYAPGEVVETIRVRREVAADGTVTHVARTGERDLPYGTYELSEVATGRGYVLDGTSRQWRRTVAVGHDGGDAHVIFARDASGMSCADGLRAELLTADLAVRNQVVRSDFNFEKKDEETMAAMADVAFLVTSETTGESHVIVTDGNGIFTSNARDSEGRGGRPHTNKTNANDPGQPFSNGATALDADGSVYVKDSSKLDHAAGTWFAGASPERTRWADDGGSYAIDGHRAEVTDGLRALPFDTYRVEELRCAGNEGRNLVSFEVALRTPSQDPDDGGLDVHVGTIDDSTPSLATSLEAAGGGKVVAAAEGQSVTDRVWYANLPKGGGYTVRGELRVLNDDGTAGDVVATREADLTAASGIGVTEMPFGFDASGLGGRTLVALERVYRGSELVCEHADPTDGAQQVRVPGVGTTLTDDNGGDHEVTDDGGRYRLTDRVSYRNLEAGVPYRLTGELHAVRGGEDMGVVATAGATFRARGEGGAVDVPFDVDASVVEGGSDLVAFETVDLGWDGSDMASHRDLSDGGQTVHVPRVETTAADKSTGDHELPAQAGQTVTDTVRLTNLTPGHEYTVTGTLHAKSVSADGTVSDGGVVRRADGSEVTATARLKATKAAHDVTMEFADVDLSAWQGRSAVAFEDLRRGDALVATHADVTDEDQTVTVPGLRTTATDALDGDKLVFAAPGQTVTDTVHLTNLVPGRRYTVSGELHRRAADEAGNATDIGIVTWVAGGEDGHSAQFLALASASASFTAEAREQDVDVTFEDVDLTDCQGQTLVAFEGLSRDGDGKALAEHRDIADDAQAVTVVSVGTTMTADQTALHEVQPGMDGRPKTIALADAVSYKNLSLDHEYEVRGVLHARDAEGRDMGAIRGADGKEVAATTRFRPEKTSGTVDVTFEVDATDFDGTYVAFEYLTLDGRPVASHERIEDEGQSVHVVDLHTKATDKADGDNVLDDVDGQVIVDAVSYTNLVPGREYTVTGTIHLKADGGDAGVVQGATASRTFVPETPDGTVDVEIPVNASELGDCHLVAFEDLSQDGRVVGRHADIEDEDQSVDVEKPEVPHHDMPSTGLASPWVALVVLGAAALGGGIAWTARRRHGRH